MRTRAQAADPTALDLPYLSTLYGVPEADLTALAQAPTTELVTSFLESLVTKGHEFDALQADKLRVDVELENSVRTSEAKIKAQKAQLTKHVKDVEDLRTKLNEVESAREKLVTELEQLRSSTSGSTAETQALRQRIETLEASNRDAFALVEQKTTEKDRLATELSEQHGKLLTLRREIGQLEEKNQSLENAASSQRFKEQSLQQEIDLVKRNNEWHSNELQTRSQEQAKFRKERNARIASLQQELEDSNASVETLKRTETNLRQRVEQLQAKADEAFAKIASLHEDASRKEESFGTELAASKRLSDLQAQSAATHKARLEQVQGQIDQIKEDAADEIGRLQAEIETERSDKEQAERKVAELELTVERLEQHPRASHPGTPMRNGNLDPATPGRLGSRAGSPTAMSGSLRKSVGGLSFTQLYSNFTEVQQELENERRRTQKLSTAMDELITEIESRSPEILELRSEQERLEAEVLDFSRLLDDAKETRERLVKESEAWQSEAEANGREVDMLRQQLRDLAAQVRMLLVESQSREQGLDEMSAAERLELARVARGELDAAALEDMTSTGRLIQERLVIFRNVSDLQEKNQQMIRLTQQLGDRLEGEEAQAKARQNVALGQEKEQLEQQVKRLQDELQATVTQIDSYVKERDMFRRMLQHRGVLQPGADFEAMFGHSLPPATPQRNGLDPAQTPRSKDMEDLHKLLKEQQAFFDQYRNESATDRRMLKDQADTLAREKSTLQSDIARVQSQLTLASERYEMLQSNFAALRNENVELQKRSQQMSEAAAKQDLRTQQVAEELVEARSMAESLRNENANAKAEKELWKRIETRLSEDNRNLMDEKSRLQKLVTDLQNLQNERELADSESRRKLQVRVETLEAELAEAKKKLEQEVEDGRKATLRREYDEGQSRTRIDDLVKSLGNVREDLVAAKTTRDQLQARVDELKIELRSAEEKVTALQTRPTPRPEPQQNSGPQANGETNNDDLSAEQRLAVEVAEVRRDLELARNDLENTRQQIEQYRNIAQSTEEELASFNETSEQYKGETDRIIAEKDAQVSELQQRVDELSTELNNSNTELSGLRSKSDEHSRALSEQKADFESELARLRDDAERYAEEKKLYQEDLKAQAEIAQQAQQSYEDELLKHAEAARSLQAIRTQYNELRGQVSGIRAEAEAAKGSLESGEESWAKQREHFERELDDAKRRREDFDQQNKLLHEQMEAFSAELAALRSGRQLPTGENGIVERASTPSGGDHNLQEVIKFLRREKEIVDVQYELSIQEAKRMQQQLDYANTQVEETRQKLAEERRQSVDKMASEGSTNKLMQTINELNLFRESSVTLRNEARQAREKFEEKSREVERLVSELEPLKGRVGELEGQLESKEGEIKLLQDDRDHWRERTQNIISKYDRVDPAELEEMKTQLEAARAEKERLESEQVPLREQVDSFVQRIEDAKVEAQKPLEERLNRFKDQAKEQNRKQNDKIRQITDELNAAKAETDKVAGELEQTKKALQEAQANATKQDGEEGEVHENDATGGGQGDEHVALHARIAESEANASEHARRADTLQSEVETLKARVQELEGQVDTLQHQLESAQGSVEQAQTQGSASADSETLEKLRQEFATAQQEVETLRSNALAAPERGQPMVNAQPNEGEESVADQVAEQVAKLRSEHEQQHELAMKQMEEERDKRVEKMKANLSRQLREEKEKMKEEARQELIHQHSVEVQKLKDEHGAAINQLKADHEAELERLRQEGSTAVQKANGDVKIEPTPIATTEALLALPENEILELLKTNHRVRVIFSNNIKKGVATETEKLNKIITEKDEEIARLKKAQSSATTSDAKKEELVKKLDEAQQVKAKAVAQAVDNEQKKVKVQLSQLALLNAKINAVRAAFKEMPDEPIGKVWPEADKARPLKPGAPTTGVAATGSPAQKPNVPVSTATAQPAEVTAAQPQQDAEQAKLQARAQRFGTAPAATTSQPASQTTGSFGQASAISQPTPTTFGSGSFGQPSQPGTPAQPVPHSSAKPATGTPPNPQAPAFTPGADGAASTKTRQNSGKGPAAVRGLSRDIPRGGSNLPRGAGVSGRGSISIQGAANAQTQPGPPPQRGGGGQSGLPRGPGNAGRGGRGSFGAASRGAAANAGQKRQHDGSDGGDEKRIRGGGPTGGA